MKGYSFRSLTDLVLKIFKTKVNAGTGLSGGGSLEADRTLTVNYGTIAGTAAQGNDSRLSNSREWTAETISQAETEAGAATTRRAFTAQRVRQAIVAWFNGISGALGRTILTRTTAEQVRSDIGLGTAATANTTTSNTDGTVGRVLKVGDGGWMGFGSYQDDPYGYPTSRVDKTNQTKVIRSSSLDNGVHAHVAGIHFSAVQHWGRLRVSYASPDAWLQGGHSQNGTGWTSPVVLSANLLQTTGTSSDFPMSQKATTDHLNTKANNSTQVIAGTGLTGGGNLSANRTLNVSYGTTAGTAAQGNDSRITGALQSSQVVQTVGASTSNMMSQKAVTDLFTNMQPSITGSCTTNGTTNNTLGLTGIVPALALEVGDVIQITGSTGGLNDKLFTVESITGDNSIIVNYEHAGNRGNGSLKLANQTATVTIKRISKWYNAPLGMGQAWVKIGGVRILNTGYISPPNRSFGIYITNNTFQAGNNNTYILTVDGANVISHGDDMTNGLHFAVINISNNYKFNGPAATVTGWQELR